MIGIGALIGIVSSVIQIAQAVNRPDPAEQKADKLFSELDAMGKGNIQSADLQSAFERIKTTATGGAEKLFSKLDSDGDGKITRSEFTGSISQLADQLDQHFMRSRVHGESSMPPALGNTSFSRDELTGLASSIASNFDKADANGDGRVSLKEARALGQQAIDGAVPNLQSAATDNRNVEMMLMVVRLMQAYGVVGGSSTTADNGDAAAAKVSERV